MIEIKYHPKEEQSVDKSALDRRRDPENVADEVPYKGRRYSHYNEIFGSGRFPTGEMIVRAQHWV